MALVPAVAWAALLAIVRLGSFPCVRTTVPSTTCTCRASRLLPVRHLLLQGSFPGRVVGELFQKNKVQVLVSSSFPLTPKCLCRGLEPVTTEK